MALSLFDNKSSKPTTETLAAALGKSIQLWNRIVEYVASQHPNAVEEWKFSGPKYGWSFRLKDKKRNLIYLVPSKGFLQAAFVFGDKAVAEVVASALPESIKNELKNATRYAEGRGIRLQVRKQSDVSHVKKLVDIKVRN
jgi:hypothetical protein